MKRIERVKLYPTASQGARLQACLGVGRKLYNTALEQRRDAWRSRRLRIDHKRQYAELTELRAADLRVASIYRELQDAALHKLDLAFRAFFRRCKTGGAPGFPRFRSARRYRISPRQPCPEVQWRPDQGQGPRRWQRGLSTRSCRSRLWPGYARAFPAWLVRFVRVRARSQSFARNGESGRHRCGHCGLLRDVGWPHRTKSSVGQEARGSRSSLATDHSQTLPRQCWAAQGGQSICASARSAALGETRLASQASAQLSWYDAIAFEKLPLRSMTRSAQGNTQAPAKNVRQKSGLNRAILDAGWSRFTNVVVDKAAEAGRQIVFVNAKYTSQTCSRCECVDTANRCTQALFVCVFCGFALHADVNAAVNILKRAKLSPAARGAALADPADPRSVLSPARTWLAQHDAARGRIQRRQGTE